MEESGFFQGQGYAHLCQLSLLLVQQTFILEWGFYQDFSFFFSTWVFCGGWNKRRKIILFIHRAVDIQHPAILAQALPGAPWSCLMLEFTFFLTLPISGGPTPSSSPGRGDPLGSSTIRIPGFDKKAG